MNEEPQNHLTLWKDTAVQADAPPQPVPENNLLPCPENKIATSGFLQVVPPETPQPVPEEFPLTLDCGVIPWSKIPIAEITPGTWFKYDKFEGTDSTVFNVSDGNGRTLFHCCEEEIASFAVKAMNLYVQAAMSTQV